MERQQPSTFRCRDYTVAEQRFAFQGSPGLTGPVLFLYRQDMGRALILLSLPIGVAAIITGTAVLGVLAFCVLFFGAAAV